MAQKQNNGFSVPNSTIAFMLVLTVAFLVWSFATISSSTSNLDVAPVLVENHPDSGAAHLRIGPGPVVLTNPVVSGQASLTLERTT